LNSPYSIQKLKFFLKKQKRHLDELQKIFSKNGLQISRKDCGGESVFNTKPVKTEKLDAWTAHE
jgi:hypothetical protein